MPETATETVQSRMTFGPVAPQVPTRPAEWLPPETVPVTTRFEIVAPSMTLNGATQSPVPEMATVSVWPLPLNTPAKGWPESPTMLVTGPTSFARRTFTSSVARPPATAAESASQSPTLSIMIGAS